MTLAVNPYPDIKGATLSESEGRFTDLSYDYLVTGITDVGPAGLFQAIGASGIPEYGDAHPTNGNLVVFDRSVSYEDSDPTSARVTVKYGHITEFEAGDLLGSIIVHTNVSVNQVDSELDAYGNQVIVAHTYSNDPNHEDGTQYQGASVPVMRPAVTRTIVGLATLAVPSAISAYYIGTINGVVWGYDPIGTWLCTNASYVPHNFAVSGPLTTWKFTFEFEFNRDGWQPTVAFIDSVTSKPPSGLVAGVGLKTIEAYRYTDFNSITPNVL